MNETSRYYDEHFSKRLKKRPTISKHILFNETIRRIEKSGVYASTTDKLKLLDVGCGAGHLIARLVRNPRLDCTGVDITEKVIEELRRIYQGAVFEIGDFSKPMEPEPLFDLVTAVEILEHIPYSQQELFIENIAKSLRPGGNLILTTPNLDRAHRIPRAFRNTQPVEDWVTMDRLQSLLSPWFDDIQLQTCIWYFPIRVIDALFKRVCYPFHVGMEQRLIENTGLGGHIIVTATRT